MAPTVRLLEKDPPGASLARFLICETLSDGMPEHAADLARQHARSTPQIAKAYDLILQRAPLVQTKGGVAAGTTTGTGYLAELAQAGVATEAFNVLVSPTVYGQLLPGMRRVPWRVATPREVGLGAAGAWRGQALPTPARSALTDKVTLDYREMSILMAVTKEAMRFGRMTEAFVSTAVARAVRTFLDQQLLDPSIAATSTSPASLTYAAPTIISTGSSAAQITSDLALMVASITTPMNAAFWIMRPQTYYTILARLAAAGASQPANTLVGIAVILSSASPAQIALIDAEAFATATDEQLLVEANTQTSIEMVDTGLTQDGSSGTGTAQVSMFQTGSVAIRAVLAANWAPTVTRSGSPADTAGACTMAVAY